MTPWTRFSAFCAMFRVTLKGELCKDPVFRFERIDSLYVCTKIEESYRSDFEECTENEQQVLSPDTTTFADEWERKMNNDRPDKPIQQ